MPIVGKMLDPDPEGKMRLVLRQSQQNGVFQDGDVERKVEFTTAIGGKNSGCPIIEIDQFKVVFEFDDLFNEALRVLREAGHLPKEEK